MVTLSYSAITNKREDKTATKSLDGKSSVMSPTQEPDSSELLLIKHVRDGREVHV